MRDFLSWSADHDSDMDLLRQCAASVKSVEPDASVILYGSRSRGDALPDSDFDLLILVDEEPTLVLEDRIRDALYPLELETGAVLSLIVESRSRWRTTLYQTMPLVRAVEREGVVLS